MNILELAILKKMVGGGGGSGTDNYNDLSNLPQINGETLAGNKTAENLGLQDALTFDSEPTEDSTNPVESGGIYTALSGKQDAINDLETIRSGAAAGASAVQPSEMETALSAKQDSLSETQLAAVNSGIDSNKVGQISTNQTNILSVEDMICDTEFSTSTAYAVGDIVTHEHGLYKFNTAHSAGAWNSADVTQIDVVGIIGNINTVLEGVL